MPRVFNQISLSLLIAEILNEVLVDFGPLFGDHIEQLVFDVALNHDFILARDR